MKEIKNYFVADSFTDHVFGGGPAGVLIMDEWLSDEIMQNISMENNLADTAFAVRRSDGDYDLRWFMPEAEISLNGHATLAAGYCIMNYIESGRNKVNFHTKSGELSVEKMHCNLTPYWTKNLGKDSLISHQLSKRGAEVICSLNGNRVRLKGKVALFLKSEINVG